METQCMKKEKKIVLAKLYFYGNTKLLIDNQLVLYHYTDNVPIGYIDKETNKTYFLYETKEEYNIARLENNIIIKRITD